MKKHFFCVHYPLSSSPSGLLPPCVHILFTLLHIYTDQLPFPPSSSTCAVYPPAFLPPSPPLVHHPLSSSSAFLHMYTINTLYTSLTPRLLHLSTCNPPLTSLSSPMSLYMKITTMFSPIDITPHAAYCSNNERDEWEGLKLTITQ